MQYSQAVENLSQDMIDKLISAIEVGRWENGDKLTQEQTESAMQAVILWQAKNVDNPDFEPFVVGPNGELFTGKGESHKVTQSDKYDENSLIVKHKV